MLKSTIIFALIAFYSYAQEKCIWKPNNKELIEGNMVLQATVPNGEKYLIGDLNDQNKNYLYVAKLKGSSYEMGKAYGQLFKEELKQQFELFYRYLENEIGKKISTLTLPPFLAKFLTQNSIAGLNPLLDLDVLVTKRYTHPRYAEQIKGIADGAGFGLRNLTRLNIFPQFIKAACTAAGIWKQASSLNHTLHMRALDWDADSPINKFPIITVYHPTEKGAIKHANLGYVGFVGVLTGLSEKISVGEKVWIVQHPKHIVKTTRFGNPWTYVLRDLLYEAQNMTHAIQILKRTPRTCTIHLGIASLQEHNFRMFLYAQNVLQNYNDVNYTHYTVNHTQKNGIAFFNKHVQPNNDPCMSKTITNQTQYGNWNLESFWRVIGGVHETGDTQLVVFDLEGQQLLISYSANYINQTTNRTYAVPAYHRSPIHIQMSDLWSSF